MSLRPVVHTLDLNFQGLPGTIAAYLVPHSGGCALIECGPGSTLEDLQIALQTHHLTVNDITHVFVTHIHLDHAGAAGWLARQGAKIYVHPFGAPHLINPEKLLASASRLYGEMMDRLWGEFLAVPEDKLQVLHDGDVVDIDQFQIRAIETPGHASHHLTYLLGDIAFSGDIGGVRLGRQSHIRLPMPPPEFQPPLWRESIQRLQKEEFSYIAPTHFGIFPDRNEHLAEVLRGLDRAEAWMQSVMPADPTVEELRRNFIQLENESPISANLDDEILRDYETASPSFMSADGIYRYWKKSRSGN